MQSLRVGVTAGRISPKIRPNRFLGFSRGFHFLVSNNQIRGYSRPIIYWGVYDFPVLIFSAHSPSFLISCTRLFAYNNNFLSPSLWYIRLLITRIIEWQA